MESKFLEIVQMSIYKLQKLQVVRNKPLKPLLNFDRRTVFVESGWYS